MKLLHQFAKLYTQEIRHLAFEARGAVGFVARAFRCAFLLSASSFAKMTLISIFVCGSVFIFKPFNKTESVIVSLGVITVLFSLAYTKNLIKALSSSKYSYDYTRD